MAKELRILLIEDVPTDAELEVRELKRAGLRVAHRVVDTEAAYREALRDFRPDAILSDFSMPHFDGMQALAVARELVPDVPFIFVSGTIGEEYAIRALKDGATDYVLKNNLVRLPAAVERALQEAEAHKARRKAEHEIQRQRAFLRQVIDLDRNRVFAKDRDGRFTLVNQALAEAYGTTVEGLIGKTNEDLVHDREQAERLRKLDLEVLDNRRELFIPEHQMVDAAGNVRWFQVMKRPFISADGTADMVLSIAVDITERKRHEEALSESEYRLDLALEASELAVWDWNLATGDVRFSRHWWPILGYEPDEIPLRIEAWEKLTHPDDLARVKSLLAATVKGSVPVLDDEYRMRTKSGEWIWIRTVGRVMGRDAAGRAVRMTGTHGDVTERRLQQEKIARLSRIQAVLSGINSAIVHIRDRQELFNEACRIAVEHGKLGMAWIGSLDPAAQEVTPVAWAGLEASEYLGGVKSIIRDDLPQGRGVLARAIRSREPVFDNDITLDPAAGGKRRAEAIRRGYRSVVVLPLIVEGEVMGSLSLFAKELNFFDDEELTLLAELAGDVSFALEHIAGQERIEKLSRVRAVSSGINAAIVRIRDREGLLRETCRIASEEGKFEMIWIGTINSEKQEVRPVVWTAFSDETAHAVSWATIEAARGPVGEAIQTKKVAVRNDIENGMPAGILRQEAMKKGCFSTTCLPLLVDEKVVGLIALYAAGRGAFDEDELALLGDVASNVSFALEAIARQEKIERLSRIRAVLGEMNAAIVRIRSKQQLFEEACRIAHEHGKFPMSWIGILDEATQAIRPVAKAGREEGYLEQLNLSIDPNITRNLALAVEAIGRSAPVICNDIAADGRMRAWRAAALERGYRSNVMLPLLVDQRAVGVFALYSPETGFFDEEEMKLLVELAGDIAFALQTIEKQEKLDYLSYYDQLTGLPNRTLFNDRLEQRVSAARRDGKTFAVVTLDLERFRNINETLGRQGGDDVIRQVGQRLKNALEGTDILAHIGGDHFTIATRRGENNGDVAHILEQILRGAFGQPFQATGTELRVAARAGVAVYPEDGADCEVLLRNSEAALNKAKVSGERYLFYQAKMNAAVAQNLLLENKLRQALEKEQFVLHYQPKVDLAKGTLIGLEALIRWNDPETGLVPPMRFIPLLEETGMILDVGRWAILKALEDYRNWHARGLKPPRIAVNVSPIQLRQKNFVNVVRDAIGESAAGSHGLELEITESLIMEDIEGSIEKLRAVRDMGVTIAIDDFGTGYSSLGYLAKLPVNALKIDRSFIITMAKSADSMTIVSTIISMAHSLNLKVIAEGVDSEDQRSLLKLLKCDEMQGYLFSRPVTAAEVEAKFLGSAAAT